MAGGYRASQVVLTGVRLRIFDLVASGPQTADQLAAALRADPRGVRILCDALVSLQIFEKTEGRYRNSAEANRFLRTDSPESRAASLLHAAVLYQRWGALYDSVKEGRGADDDKVDPRLATDKAAFASAMADIGRVSARQTAAALELSEVRRLLDIGGGPAVYAIELARRHPSLKVVVCDDAETLQTARRNVRQAGLEDRISFLPGDAFESDLGGSYDAVFISNLVHIFSAERNRLLVGRCAEVLQPGGRLIIKDFLLDPDRTSPPGAALFAVNMLVNTDEGDCYTVDQIRSWTSAAGMNLESVSPLTEQSSLIIARKPG